MLTLVVLSLLLTPAVLGCDMCKMGMNIDHSQQGMSMAGQQTNLEAQQKIQQLQDSNKMMEKMMMMMMMEKMSKHQSWGGWGGDKQGEQVCQGIGDIVFVLDSSGSIGQENYDKQLKFLGDVAGHFQLSQGGGPGYQVSVVTYSALVREEFPLNRFDNVTAMKEAISNIAYMSSSTNTHKALEYVRDESYLASRGSRTGAIKIAIFITDGRSANKAETLAKARDLHNKGIMVISIGVGGDLDLEEIKNIASSDRNVFQVANITVLESIKEAVGTRACTITIEQGGAILTGDIDQEAYKEMVEEQKRLEKEHQQQLEILDSFAAFGNKEKEEYQVTHDAEEQKEKMEFMQASIKSAMAEMEHYDELSTRKNEMHHEYLYTVSANMIRFCPLSADSTIDMMKFMGHGDNSWSPGDEDECNVEDLPTVNQNDDPMIIAQQLATMTKEDQIKLFFSGVKDSVCAAMKVYLGQLKNWEQTYPDFSRMF